VSLTTIDLDVGCPSLQHLGQATRRAFGLSPSALAHSNFPLRLLRHARRLQHLSIEQAVWCCSGEIADWLGLDAGVLREGARAHVVVIDPAGLDEPLERAVLAPMPDLGGFARLVRRNDDAVRPVLIAGAVAVESGRPTPALGTTRLGRVLRRRESTTTAAPGSTTQAAAL
jgi:N-acyl-D-aspartate/D-glutamate deacylase